MNNRAFPITPGRVYQIVLEAAERAGVENIKPHDLRRTYAKLSRRGGAPLEQVQVTLGHKDLATTQRYLGTQLEVERGRGCGDFIQLHNEKDNEKGNPHA